MDEAVEEWVRSELRVLEIQPGRSRPWAEVWRVETVDGVWWAKVSAAGTSHEPRLLNWLSSLGSDLLPRSISHPSEPWLLTADAGVSARDHLAGADRSIVLEFWCDLVQRYAQLQRSVPAHDLHQLGMPDLSPEHLSTVLDQLLSDGRWFTSAVAPGFDPDRLRAIAPQLAMASAALASGRPATVQHDDLHEGNVFVDHQRVTVIDWGDAVIGHPFATMRVTLDSLARRLGDPVSSAGVRRVSEAYLEVWSTGGVTRSELRRELQLAMAVAGLGRAAGWARALGSPEAGAPLGYADAVAGWLTELAHDLLVM